MPRSPTATFAPAVCLTPLAASSVYCFPPSSLSPTPSSRKATAMYRKRRRDWHAADDPESGHDEGERMDAPPLPPLGSYTRRRSPPPSSWSSASNAAADWKQAMDDHEFDRHEGTDHDDTEPSPSIYREIQQRVDQVGAQVAQAQRDVAELRALLLQAAAQPTPSPRPMGATTPRRPASPSPSTPSQPAATSTTARVRIDRLCS